MGVYTGEWGVLGYYGRYTVFEIMLCTYLQEYIASCGVKKLYHFFKSSSYILRIFEIKINPVHEYKVPPTLVPI